MIVNSAMEQTLAKMRLLTAEAQGIRNFDAQNAASAEKTNADFSQVLTRALDSVNDAQLKADDLQLAYAKGDPNTNLVDVMLAAQKANLSFQATLQVRNKLVSAYQDIMNLPV